MRGGTAIRAKSVRAGVCALAIGAMLAMACSDNKEAVGPSTSSVTLPQRTQEAAATLRALSGAWAGEWRDAAGAESGTMRMEWQQVGRVLRGSLAVSGTSCVPGGGITAVVNGERIDFEATSPEAKVTYTGTVAGDTITGSYVSTCADAKGVWQASRA